jgi:cytochrome bd-type quinol oxidase subunit 2
MHPLLTLLATRPQLLLGHAQAYAALLHEDFGLASASWRRRVLLHALALCSLGVTAVLAGGALMLWAVTPTPQIHSLWILYVTPVVPLMCALVCVVLAHRQSQEDFFANLNLQIDADVAMLRAASLL